jgi:hypothetical protein
MGSFLLEYKYVDELIPLNFEQKKRLEINLSALNIL